MAHNNALKYWKISVNASILCSGKLLEKLQLSSNWVILEMLQNPQAIQCKHIAQQKKRKKKIIN
jgi:hypothetical protein